MESHLVRRVTGFVADLKNRCGEFFLRSASTLRRLFLHSEDGVDLEAPNLRTDRVSVLNGVTTMAALSVTALVEVSIGYLQVRSQLPTEFTLFCLALILALACFFVAICIYQTLPSTTRVLRMVGGFLLFTGVFIIVTVPFPHFFKIITGAVYIIAVAAILVARYLNPQ